MKYYEQSIIGPLKRWIIGFMNASPENVELYLVDGTFWCTKNMWTGELSVCNFQIFHSEEDALIAKLAMLKLSTNKLCQNFAEIKEVENRIMLLNPDEVNSFDKNKTKCLTIKDGMDKKGHVNLNLKSLSEKVKKIKTSAQKIDKNFTVIPGSEFEKDIKLLTGVIADILTDLDKEGN